MHRDGGGIPRVPPRAPTRRRPRPRRPRGRALAPRGRRVSRRREGCERVPAVARRRVRRVRPARAPRLPRRDPIHHAREPADRALPPPIRRPARERRRGGRRRRRLILIRRLSLLSSGRRRPPRVQHRLVLPPRPSLGPSRFALLRRRRRRVEHAHAPAPRSRADGVRRHESFVRERVRAVGAALCQEFHTAETHGRAALEHVLGAAPRHGQARDDPAEARGRADPAQAQVRRGEAQEQAVDARQEHGDGGGNKDERGDAEPEQRALLQSAAPRGRLRRVGGLVRVRGHAGFGVGGERNARRRNDRDDRDDRPDRRALVRGAASASLEGPPAAVLRPALPSSSSSSSSSSSAAAARRRRSGRRRSPRTPPRSPWRRSTRRFATFAAAREGSRRSSSAGSTLHGAPPRVPGAAGMGRHRDIPRASLRAGRSPAARFASA